MNLTRIFTSWFMTNSIYFGKLPPFKNKQALKHSIDSMIKALGHISLGFEFRSQQHQAAAGFLSKNLVSSTQLYPVSIVSRFR